MGLYVQLGVSSRIRLSWQDVVPKFGSALIADAFSTAWGPDGSASHPKEPGRLFYFTASVLQTSTLNPEEPIN